VLPRVFETDWQTKRADSTNINDEVKTNDKQRNIRSIYPVTVNKSTLCAAAVDVNQTNIASNNGASTGFNLAPANPRPIYKSFKIEKIR